MLDEGDYDLLAEWMEEYQKDYQCIEEAIEHCVEDYIAGRNAYVLGG